ncbi:hypothetical protein CFRA_10390 [Corynebacterium frankenforstense DSM 45800]|uniref:Uncharacterized protein n=1 Tax=Corynebacterium frankenforstense DSM 45800 TaxID=1437875 RepID=A0A1L7CUS5_9CORY|nr:hypothetical protein [Corynebacterium frankenforstense]APT89567.1 hypothetical protein CFRA_10390 [Corynebacterium frankenforstense DSM 45800]
MDFSVLSQIWSQQFDELSTFAENIKVFFQGIPDFFIQLAKSFGSENIDNTKGLFPTETTEAPASDAGTDGAA